jgi:hypothetical protein
LAIVTVQVLFCAGWQLADHPAKTDPGAGIAVKLTWLFNVKLAEHPVPELVLQLIPVGVLVIVPVPRPGPEMVNVGEMI